MRQYYAEDGKIALVLHDDDTFRFDRERVNYGPEHGRRTEADGPRGVGRFGRIAARRKKRNDLAQRLRDAIVRELVPQDCTFGEMT